MVTPAQNNEALLPTLRHPDTCVAPENIEEEWTRDLAMKIVQQDQFGRLILGYGGKWQGANSITHHTPVNFCPWCGFRGVPW